MTSVTMYNPANGLPVQVRATQVAVYESAGYTVRKKTKKKPKTTEEADDGSK